MHMEMYTSPPRSLSAAEGLVAPTSSLQPPTSHRPHTIPPISSTQHLVPDDVDGGRPRREPDPVRLHVVPRAHLPPDGPPHPPHHAAVESGPEVDLEKKKQEVQQLQLKAVCLL